MLPYRLNTTLYLDSISAGLKSNSNKFVKVISRKSKWLGIIPTGLLESVMVILWTTFVAYTGMQQGNRFK